MLIYGKFARTDGCKIFQDIQKKQIRKPYLLREFDVHKNSTNDEALDLSLQKCGKFHEIQGHFNQHNFWLSRPTPNAENLCDGMRFVLEDFIPSFRSLYNISNHSKGSNEYICNGTIPTTFYPHGEKFKKYMWRIRNTLFFSHHSRAVEQFGLAPQVYWSWNITKNCSTLQEMEKNIRANQTNPLIQRFLLDLYREMNHYKPAQMVTGADAIAFLGGGGGGFPFCPSATLAGVFGFGAGAYLGFKLGYKAGALSSHAKGFWNFLSNLFTAANFIDNLFDSLKDLTSEGVRECPKPQDPEHDEEEDRVAEQVANSTEPKVPKEEDGKQKGSQPENVRFFSLKENMKNNKEAAPCGITATGENLVKLANLANQDFVSTDFHGALNEADLVLARGAGLFINDFETDEIKHFLETSYICRKHLAEFGKGWDTITKTNLRRFIKKGNVRGIKCDVQNFGSNPVAKASHSQTVFSSFLTNREQSNVLLDSLQTFVPLGQRKLKNQIHIQQFTFTL